MNCYYKNNWYLIYGLDDFKELMNENVYSCLLEFIEKEYESKIKDLEQELYLIEGEKDDLESENDELQCKIEDLEYELEELRGECE